MSASLRERVARAREALILIEAACAANDVTIDDIGATDLLTAIGTAAATADEELYWLRNLSAAILDIVVAELKISTRSPKRSMNR